MSALFDLLQSTISDSSISQLSRQLGQDERTTSNAVSAALPMLIGALNKSTDGDAGAGLANALDSKHDGSILDDVSGYLGRNDQTEGNGILGHILGGNQSAAANMLGQAAGIDQQNAGSLLASLAPIVLGALGKAKSANNLSASGLSQLLSGESDSLAQRTPSAMSAVMGMLDADGDGDTDLGDLLKAGSKGLGSLFR